MTHVTVMTGPERRRHWRDDERRIIVAAANAPGAVVAEVARRYDVSTSLIYKWRREQSEMTFVPALVVDDEKMPSATARAVTPVIVVDLAQGVRVSICAGASVALVGVALKALR
jgi:transposase